MMKVKNKLTGEINLLKVDEDYFKIYKDDGEFVCPVTLKELNDGWEDAPEEPKVGYIIDPMGEDCVSADDCHEKTDVERAKDLGIWFETEEEAVLAIRKLKAWKILMEMGFKIEGIRYRNNKNYIEWSISQKVRDEDFNGWSFNDALHLLFGGEE